jgi:hypothetical protein
MSKQSWLVQMRNGFGDELISLTSDSSNSYIWSLDVASYLSERYSSPQLHFVPYYIR